MLDGLFGKFCPVAHIRNGNRPVGDRINSEFHLEVSDGRVRKFTDTHIHCV